MFLHLPLYWWWWWITVVNTDWWWQLGVLQSWWWACVEWGLWWWSWVKWWGWWWQTCILLVASSTSSMTLCRAWFSIVVARAMFAQGCRSRSGPSGYGLTTFSCADWSILSDRSLQRKASANHPAYLQLVHILATHICKYSNHYQIMAIPSRKRIELPALLLALEAQVEATP